MYVLFPLLFFVLFSSIGYTQPVLQWQKALGGSNSDEFNSAQRTVDGGYILAGTTFSNDGDVSGNHGKHDFWIVKLNPSGALQWQRVLGGSNSEEAYCVETTKDGGCVAVGETWSGYPDDGDVSGHHNNTDYWIVKLDANGALQWQKALGGSLWDVAEAILQTGDGGYVVVGSAASTDGDLLGVNGYTGCWMVKLDAAGNMQWQKALAGAAGAYSMQIAADGGYILAGATYASLPDHHGPANLPDFWVAKTDSLGLMQWQRSLGGSAEDLARSVCLSPDGGYVLTGHSRSNDGDVVGNHGASDFWIVKLDPAGKIQWQRSLGGTNRDEAESVVPASGGGYAVGGASWSNDGDVSGNHGDADFWIAQLDSAGTLLWQKSIGGSKYDILRAMQSGSNGAYVLAGYSRSQDGDVSGTYAGSSDGWVLRLGLDQPPSAEEPCDVKETGCVKYELLPIAKDPAGRKTYRVRLTNSCAGPMRYAAIQLPAGTTADAPADNALFAAPGGHLYDVRNPNESPIYSIRFKALGAGISKGQSEVFTYTLPAQADPAYINVVAHIEPDSYLEAYLNVFNCPVETTPGAASREAQNKMHIPLNEAIQVYPNPAHHVLQVDLADWPDQKTTFRIWNAQGLAMQQTVIETEDQRLMVIDLPEQLPGGLYFLEVQNAAGRRRILRFMVER